MASRLYGGVVALSDLDTGERFNARVLLTLDEDEIIYTVAPISGGADLHQIRSASPEVCAFYRRIAGEFRRVAAGAA